MDSYSVILRWPSSSVSHRPRVAAYSLSARTADAALVTAAEQYPECQILGIEPGYIAEARPMHLRGDDSQAA